MNPAQSPSRPRVLITEDDAFTANLCRDVFNREGFDARVALDGRAAIDFLANNHVDAVLLDLMLPEVDGIGVLEFIRSHDRLRTVPVIVLSNLSCFSGMVQSAWNAGATNFIKKGAADPAALVMEVRNLIQPAAAAAPPPPPPAAPAPLQSQVPAPEPSPFIPVREPEIVAEPVPEPVAAPKSYKVLVADDDRLVQSVINFFMTQAGYQVEAAHDGREALEKAVVSRPDVMILDGLMPELDGIEVVDRWFRDTRLHRIPIIMLTADPETHRRVGNMKGTNVSILSKPFSPEKLVQRVSQVMAAG